MTSGPGQRRRALKYIRLAAFLAGQPTEVDRVRMPLREIEDVVGETLPEGARFPSWWRNDGRRSHSRAWLLAGWRVEEVGEDCSVVFVRAPLEDAL